MKALTLDVAGTLCDLAEPVGTTYARLADSVGLKLHAPELEANFRETFPTLAPPVYEEDRDGHEIEKDWWRRLVLKTTQLEDSPSFNRFFEITFDHYASGEAWHLYPDTLPFLEKASRSYRLAVISNFDARVHTILRELGLSGYLEVIVSSAEARARKPEAAIFHHTLEKLGLEADQCLHIGDSRSADYDGPLAAGLKACLINRPRETLETILLPEKETDPAPYQTND
jgi:putative hydrolase of the HAD superfamily